MYRTHTPRHKVFVSFHHYDQVYKDCFIRMMGEDIVDESVGDGDIDDKLPTQRMRQIIRDEFIRDATITIVLIGPCTWQRKYVDWEIGSSLRATKLNSRCGLLGILLPNHPNFGKKRYSPHLIPPRLADNCNGNDPFAYIYDWPDPQGVSAIDLLCLNHGIVPEGIRLLGNTIRDWIHQAFERRHERPAPDNSRPQFVRNRSGDCLAGWRDY